MPRHGCRNMYRLTGQPGWLRFGHSPGWLGRSPSGLGPCAEYMLTGSWPSVRDSVAGASKGEEVFSGKDELSVLKAREEFLKRHLEELRKRIGELEQE